MKLARCQGCGQRSDAKYVSAYLAWFNQEGDRVAYKSRLCMNCFNEHLLPYAFVQEPSDELRCPSCGIGTETDYQAVYGKVYIPGYEPEDVEIPFCESCRVVFSAWVVEHSGALEDRRRADIGPTTHPSGLEVLRAMGLPPRVR